jgi:hypothetical protein
MNEARRDRTAMALVVCETIRELGEVPSGQLYAMLLGHLTMETYNSIIDTLIRARLVSRSNHLLTWIGPRLEPSKP